ncbi:MAG: hypothetical protein HC851_20130 [Acaryochloris sp. RU_4_1]|nr:hypothetical protein [Acaryochloris sp. RU_4_1]NJR56867.1 hypothetical protein [Acaryochloris sp. CRU_2_0]
MFIYQVPCISLQHLTEADLSRLHDPQRDPSEVACMIDPNDPQNGMFVWIDEVDSGAPSDPPAGYSANFNALWHWAQGNGFTWIRLAVCGDEIEGLAVPKGG